jgi:hypothetical protein
MPEPEKSRPCANPLCRRTAKNGWKFCVPHAEMERARLFRAGLIRPAPDGGPGAYRAPSMREDTRETNGTKEPN